VSERVVEYTRTRPIYSVDLDAGAYNWLREIIEAKLRSMPPVRPPEYVEMVTRASLAFKAAYDAKEAAVTAATAPVAPSRRIKRGEPEPEPQRRIKRPQS
jgi:hypothetical protein